MAAALTNRPDLLIGDPAEEVWWMLGDRRFEAALSRLDHAPPAPAPVSAALTATGYYVSRNERGDHLIIDGGPHGYRNGGHAHADALSITFTCRHRPLLIDTGTGSYTMYPEARDRFRSSALHNTLSVNGRSQSLPRGPFHWRHIANATTRRWRVNPRFDYFVGTHDGYSPLAHHRHVLMLHDDLLIVVDGVAHVPPSEPGPDGTTRMASGPDTRQRTFEVPGSGRAVDDVHHAAVHWHVDPAWTVAHGSEHATFSADDDTVELRVAGGTMEKYVADSASGLGWHAPVYGRIEPATTLRITTTCGAPLWIVSVFGLDRDNRIERVTVAPVPGAAAGAAYTAAVQVDRIRSVDRMVIMEPRNPERNLSWQAVDVESDARMLFMREIGSVVTSMALVDATFVRSDRYPGVQRNGGPTAAVFEESAASARDRKAS
jgi:hypothetical protein